MRTLYKVQWTDADGRKQYRIFFKRPHIPREKQPATLFLNYLILDKGHWNARLRTEKTY